MKDINDNVIYVGKAIILKNRVKQYFRKTDKTARIEKMVSLIDHFEYIVTDSEAEALILECNLIKKYKPKFNVLLKDDKTYPYIKIDIKSPYPTVFITRRMQNDGARYFGPYSNQGAAKEMLNFIRSRFPIRQCKNLRTNRKPCLNYYIKRCMAPCTNQVPKEEYAKQIQSIIMLLDGKTKEILEKLDKEIYELAQKQEYEKAAILRDRKIAIEQITEKQKVSNINETSIDVIGLAKNELFICIEIFFIRNSKMIGREHYFFEKTEIIHSAEILSSFIKQYYFDKIEFPSKIFIQDNIEDKEVIEKILSEKANKKIEFKIPQKGEKLRLVEMAEKNAKITLDNKTKENENIVIQLKEALNLKEIPTKVECFDISNLSGDYMVGGMCVAINGKIKNNLARRFKIKTILTQDDPKCLEEIVTRRLKHSLKDGPTDSFGNLPDIIFADGGITQIRAIKRAINKFNLDIPVFGMVKDDYHKTKMLINEDKISIKLDNNVMNFITNLQDEVHNVAITYNRKLREKDATKSKLDLIPGIGEKKKYQLFKKFGSIEEIKKSSIEEISEIRGINKELAKKIKKELD